MRYSIIGDIHCTLNNLEEVNELFDITEQLGNPTILLGDVLDTKAIVRSECLNLIYKKISESKCHFFIIIGNHDYHNLDCLSHALLPLRSLPNVTLIEKLEEISEGLYAIPYISDTEVLLETLSKIPEDHTLLGHFEITSFDYGNGLLCTENSKAVNKQAFSRFKKVISGHFHKYQEVDNITYLGTPFSHSFGESNQDKYIAILENSNLELIKTSFPQHITVTLNKDSDLNLTLRDSNYNRIIIQGTELEVKSIKEEILSLIPPKTKIIEDIKELKDESNTPITPNMDVVSKWTTWAESVVKYPEDVILLGASILKECKNREEG